MMQVVLAPQAAFELHDAAACYNATRPGLGRTFIQQVDHTLLRIATYPEIAPVVARQFRRALIHHFPFAVVYRISGHHVQVIGIVPTQADPQRLLARLSEPTN